MTFDFRVLTLISDNSNLILKLKTNTVFLQQIYTQ